MPTASYFAPIAATRSGSTRRARRLHDPCAGHTIHRRLAWAPARNRSRRRWPLPARHQRGAGEPGPRQPRDDAKASATLLSPSLARHAALRRGKPTSDAAGGEPPALPAKTGGNHCAFPLRQPFVVRSAMHRDEAAAPIDRAGEIALATQRSSAPWAPRSRTGSLADLATRRRPRESRVCRTPIRTRRPPRRPDAAV